MFKTPWHMVGGVEGGREEAWCTMAPRQQHFSYRPMNSQPPPPPVIALNLKVPSQFFVERENKHSFQNYGDFSIANTHV